MIGWIRRHREAEERERRAARIRAQQEGFPDVESWLAAQPRPLPVARLPRSERLIQRVFCWFGWHEWHWFRQTGGGKRKCCVHCDKDAHGH